jgi:hypothetical protein
VDAKARVTTQGAAKLLGIELSDLRRLMRKGKIAPPPITFDPETSSSVRMWSEDDIEAARTVLQNESVRS